MENKCHICGATEGELIGVCCKYHYYRKVCNNCLNNKILEVSEIDKLNIKVEAIVDTLSESQKNYYNSTFRCRLINKAFENLE